MVLLDLANRRSEEYRKEDINTTRPPKTENNVSLIHISVNLTRTHLFFKWRKVFPSSGWDIQRPRVIIRITRSPTIFLEKKPPYYEELILVEGVKTNILHIDQE